MTRIVTPDTIYETITPDSEKAFEEQIVANASLIFGNGRHYLDCKRRIGGRGKFNIPDAYLIDLRRNDPRLFVVENELAAHDLFKHIGVQLLEFSFSYRQAGRQLKTVLFEEISKTPEIQQACINYAKERGFRNLDNLLDHLVFETPFQAIVIIDEATDELTTVVKQFSFPVEIIEFQIHRDSKGNHAFTFDPFLQDVVELESKAGAGPTDISELDTIVVPARHEGFQRTFLGENRWYAIRIHSSMIPQIKFIAAYQVAPTSSITHVAPVSRIIPWQDSGKFCLEFAEPAHQIGPISLDGTSKGQAPQAPRYTSIERLTKAKTLSEAF